MFRYIAPLNGAAFTRSPAGASVRGPGREPWETPQSHLLSQGQSNGAPHQSGQPNPGSGSPGGPRPARVTSSTGGSTQAMLNLGPRWPPQRLFFENLDRINSFAMPDGPLCVLMTEPGRKVHYVNSRTADLSACPARCSSAGRCRSHPGPRRGRGRNRRGYGRWRHDRACSRAAARPGYRQSPGR